MKPVFLSIITINYNNALGLENTIKSVINQSFKRFEFIVIDGASTDGSIPILEKFKDKISICISEKDTGIYNAMNKGIKVSTGEYLLFLNSGDCLHGNSALSEFINHKDFEGDIIYGDYTFKNGQKVYPDTLYPSYFMKTSLPHQSTFFKKSVFEKMGLYDETYRMSADRAFYIKCYLSDIIRFKHIKYFLTLYDLSGISNDSDFLQKKQEEDDRLLKEQYAENYSQYREELNLELKRNAVKRNSIQGIYKRMKQLWRHL